MPTLMPPLPRASLITGADGAGVAEFREHRTMALGALTNLSAHYEPIAAEGSRLAAHATVSGMHSGEFFGVAATGKTVSARRRPLYGIAARRRRQLHPHRHDRGPRWAQPDPHASRIRQIPGKAGTAMRRTASGSGRHRSRLVSRRLSLTTPANSQVLWI
jgi:hypothetical protein